MNNYISFSFELRTVFVHIFPEKKPDRFITVIFQRNVAELRFGHSFYLDCDTWFHVGKFLISSLEPKGV